MLGVPSPSGARFRTLSEGAPSTISELLPLRPPFTLTFCAAGTRIVGVHQTALHPRAGAQQLSKVSGGERRSRNLPLLHHLAEHRVLALQQRRCRLHRQGLGHGSDREFQDRDGRCRSR